MSTYKHGIYGEYIPSNEQIVTTSNTIPVYIGVAPVHRVLDSANKVNKPILISSLDDAQIELGYSDNDDFNKFTLSASIFAHFKNKVQPLGPIILINVLDPNLNKLEVEATETPVLNKKIVLGADVIVSTINIEDKILGTDYKIDIDYITGNITITFLTDVESSVTLNYSKVNINITPQDIIGSYDSNTGERKGLYCIQTIYEDLNIAPNILCVPGHGKEIAVRNKLLELSKNIGGQWDSIVYTDLDPSISNYNQALEKKSEKGLSSIDEKLCWPMGKMQGKNVFMSVLAIVRTQQTDVKNGGVPCETPSNKVIDITGLVTDTGEPVKLTIEIANKLNSKGITSALFYGGKWVLWGPHMSNFEHGETNKPEEMFDVNRRMDIYLNNDFKKRNADKIDSPMTRNDIDALINTEQIRLNALVSEGKLLFGSISFRSSNNTVSDLMQGNFVFDTVTTATIPAKSLTQKIQYSSQGIKDMMGGE